MNSISAITQDLANNVNQIISTQTTSKAGIANVGFGVPAGFQPFSVGASGNFPYYWQDPSNLKFNAKTYYWIASNLLPNTLPIQLDSLFTNLFIQALSSISYSLSTADQAALNQASANATNQQGALLLAWNNAFGGLPTGAGQPIDQVMQIITQTWANPATTLQQLQSSSNITAILNQIPPSGNSVLPSLINYLNAIASSISLFNATTSNTGYLEKALAAVQTPTLANGGLALNDGSIQPAFAVATPLQDILNGLNSTGSKNAFNFQSSVAGASTVYSVTLDNQTDVIIPAADFLTAINSDGEDIFNSAVTTDSTPAQLSMNFSGVTLVYFGPVAFSQSTLKNWYWTTPILNAIQNGTQDVSGFEFSPNPQIDFSAKGPFGYLTCVAISKTPSLNVSTQGESYQKLAATVQSNPSVNLNFLGTPLGTDETTANYTASATVNDAESSVQINFAQSAAVAGDSISSTAFVLGVQTNFPTA
jgi:hypothetical protein